jgi:hypothetical protein
MSPRLAVAQLGGEPGGSQNLWVHALTDPAFSGVEKHVLVPAGGGPKLSDEERRAAGIAPHEFGGGAWRLAHGVVKSLGFARDPLVRALDAVDPDIAWFNLAGIGEIGWIDAAAARCRARRVPYWLIVQHVHEEIGRASCRERV